MKSRINIMDILPLLTPVDDVTFVRKTHEEEVLLAVDTFYVDVAIYVIVDIHSGCLTQTNRVRS